MLGSVQDAEDALQDALLGPGGTGRGCGWPYPTPEGRWELRESVELKRRAGREFLTFGSRTLWNDLLARGLVDELHLILGAAVIGAGTPIFGAKPPGRLRLAEVRRFDGSDNLVVRYRLGPDAG
jgi:riboflavin biosynthesis pyrimidine reductase